MNLKNIIILIFFLILLFNNLVFSQPQIVQIWPQPNRVNVPVDTIIAVQFDTDMNSSTINANTFVVHGGMTGNMNGSYNYYSGSKTAVFTPDSSFKAGETIYITLTTGIHNSTGTPLTYPFYWNFTSSVGSGTGFFNLTSKMEFYWEDPLALVTGDFNNDGNVDLAMSSGAAFGAAYVKILFNDGFGNFIPGDNIQVGGNDVIAADFDGDEDLDLAVSVTGSNAMSILINDGFGRFTQNPMIALFSSPNLLLTNDFDGDGDFDLAIVMEYSEYISILLNDANGNFVVTDTMNLENDLSDITGGDYDNDGDFDLVVSYSSGSEPIILNNNGNGIFELSDTCSVEGCPNYVTSGDLNMDGFIDLAVTNWTGSSLSILINDGSGGFSSSIISSVGQWPRNIITHDFDNDGDLDLNLEIFQQSNDPQFFLILANDGNATFNQMSSISFRTGTDSRDMCSADFDNDGDLDFATIYMWHYTLPNVLYIYKNRDKEQDLALSSELLNFETVKLEKIKSKQLVLYNWGVDSTLQVYNVSSSNSAFIPDITTCDILPGDSAVLTIQFKPTNMLSYFDSLLITSNDPDEPQIKVYLKGKGNPVVEVSPPQNALNIIEDPEILASFKIPMDPVTFEANTFIVSGSKTGLHSGTYNYNGATNTATFSPNNQFKAGEVININLSNAIQNSSGQFMPNIYNWSFTISTLDGSATFSLVDTIGPLGNQMNSIISADFDNDMDVDLVLNYSFCNGFTFFKNIGNGSFNQIDIQTSESDKAGIISGDFDNDQDLDLAIVNNMNHNVSIIKNNGLGNFSETSVVGVGYGPCMIVTGYFNCDGYLDLATANKLSDDISILINDGTGVFTEVSTPRVGEEPCSITSGDWDNDGDQDLAVSNEEWNYISILFNDGSGSFVEMSRIGIRTSFITSGDLNGDGYLDLAATNEDISILLNDGLGYFSHSTVVSAGNKPVQMIIADLEGDNDLDLAVINYWSNNVSILENNGTGGFLETSVVDVGMQPVSITSADFDDDGDMDLVTANPVSGNISILFNTNSFSAHISFDIHKEYSDTVNVNYQISNPGNNTTSLLCQYSIDDGSSWNMPTLIGDTTNIQPPNYQGLILWDSYSDLPGADLDSVRFRITPYDTGGNGRTYTTESFHLDNNRKPFVQLQDEPNELSETIQLQMTLSDIENDTLLINCWYQLEGTTTWQKPTIISDTIGLIPGPSQLPITWESLQDIPQFSGYLWVKVQPADNDPGIADSIRILVDNLGVPVISTISQPVGEQSGDINFDYLIHDDESDLVSLNAKYSLDSLNWTNATVSGDTSNISPPNYQGNLTWHSGIDLSGIDSKNIWFKIVPRDAHIGIALSTQPFRVDNNFPPSVTIDSVTSPNSGVVRVPLFFQDAESDTLNSSAFYKQGTSSWQFISNFQNSVNEYIDTLDWNSSEDLGFGEFNNLQLQIIPTDNDTGTAGFSNQFDILNFAGDYTGDIQINYDDIIIFAQAWMATPQDLTKEIGPTTGQPPLLIPQPDGVMNIEDLAVLIQQLNWSFDNPNYSGNKNNLLAKISNINRTPVPQYEKLNNQYIITFEKKINENEIIKQRKEINTSFFTFEQLNYDPWFDEFGNELTFRIDSVFNLLGIELAIDYDQKFLKIDEIENNLLSKSNGISFKKVDEENGRLIINSVFLEKNSNEMSQNIFKLKLNFLEECKSEIIYSWKVNDYNGKIISQGNALIDIQGYNKIPKNYALYQNYPNPFNPSTNIRYQLPVSGKVKLVAYDILGQKVKNLLSENQKAGFYNFTWDIKNQAIATGLYFIHLSINGDNGSRFSKSIKTLLMK